MVKRKVSQQQLRRIHKVRQQKQSKTTLTGQVVTFHGKYAQVNQNHSLFHCKLRQNLGSLVVGDYVLFEPDLNESEQQKKGVVIKILPRESKLWQFDRRGREKLLAANVDQIYVVMAGIPSPSWVLLDSYLAAAHCLGIQALIVFNKIDLNQDEFAQYLTLYQKLGFKVFLVSAVTGQGKLTLAQSMASHCSIFVGQSGVGKSSLIKLLLPQETIAIGDLHQTSQLGKHTTSTAFLYTLPQEIGGGKLIDSPGIRQFGLWPMKPFELSRAFIDLAPYSDLCKFRNCRHQHEPDCAVKAALLEGEIALSRLNSYHCLLANFDL